MGELEELLEGLERIGCTQRERKYLHDLVADSDCALGWCRDRRHAYEEQSC